MRFLSIFGIIHCISQTSASFTFNRASDDGTPSERRSSEHTQESPGSEGESQNIQVIEYKEFDPVDDAIEILTAGESLPRAHVEKNLREIIDSGYNVLVGGGDLNKVKNPYLLTLYTVMCELSIKDNHDLGQPCQTLNLGDEDTKRHVMEQLVGLMNKAHGHADGEVIQMDGSHSGLHTNLLNQYAHLRRKRFSEEELRKFVDIENLVNEYATLDRQKEFKQLDLNSGESTGSNGAKTKLSGDTINVGEYLKQTKPTVAKVYLDLSKFRKEFPPSIGSEATQFKINGNYKQSEGPYDTNLVQKNKTIGGKAKADQGKENELSKFQIMKNFDKKIKRDNPLQGSPKNPLGMKAQTATNPDEVKREAAEQRLHKRQKYGNEANEKNTRRFTKESQGFAGNKLEEVPRKLEVTPVSQEHLLPGGLGKMTKSVIFEDTEEDLNEKKGATLTLKKNTKNGKKYTPVRSTNAQGEKPEDLPKTSAFHKGMQYDNERRRKEEAESLRKSDKNSLD